LGSHDWRFRAFVVDHGARAGSNEEAEAVAELVNKKGNSIAASRGQRVDKARDQHKGSQNQMAERTHTLAIFKV
jgi:tRNA(Ile)-lysidine synthase TilS/MesJ